MTIYACRHYETGEIKFFESFESRLDFLADSLDNWLPYGEFILRGL